MCNWQRAVFVWRNTHLMHTPQWIQFCAALLLKPHTLHGSHWSPYFYTPIGHNKTRHVFECYFLFHQVTISTFYALKYHKNDFSQEYLFPAFSPMQDRPHCTVASRVTPENIANCTVLAVQSAQIMWCLSVFLAVSLSRTHRTTAVQSAALPAHSLF